MSIRDHIIQWARQNEPVSINEIAEHVQILFDKQASAARQGMDAAKHHGSHMEAEAKRLHAECNPSALDSERQANADLTEELEALRGERDALAAHVKRLNTCFKSTSAMLPCDWQAEMFWLFAQVPETSLARLIAEKQAERLEGIAATLPLTRTGIWRYLQDEIAGLRRQAEELAE